MTNPMVDFWSEIPQVPPAAKNREIHEFIYRWAFCIVV